MKKKQLKELCEELLGLLSVKRTEVSRSYYEEIQRQISETLKEMRA